MSTLRVDTIYFPRPSLAQPAAEIFAQVATNVLRWFPAPHGLMQQYRAPMRPPLPVQYSAGVASWEWQTGMFAEIPRWFPAVHGQMQQTPVRRRTDFAMPHAALSPYDAWSVILTPEPDVATLVVAAVTEQGSAKPWRVRNQGYAMYAMAAINPPMIMGFLNAYVPSYRPRRR
mgnify:CR=1 FL=1